MVLLKAWPICSAPVTFGGGIMMENGLASGPALAPATKASRLSHRSRIRASAAAGSNVLSITIARIPLWSCALSTGNGSGGKDTRPRRAPAFFIFARIPWGEARRAEGQSPSDRPVDTGRQVNQRLHRRDARDLADPVERGVEFPGRA